MRCRSVGLGSATTLTVRGEVRSVIRLITPPLPAEPRPSKITSTFRPWDWIQYCSSTSCSCSRSISSSYAAVLSLPFLVYAEESVVAVDPADVVGTFRQQCGHASASGG